MRKIRYAAVTIITIIISAVVLTGLSGRVNAATIVKTFSINSGAITATLDSDGHLEITGSGDMPNALPFTSSKTQIRTVNIGPGITSIGDYNFSGCVNLTSVTGMEGVTTIGKQAFQDCAITELYIGSNVTSISQYLFGNVIRLNLVRFNVASGNQTYASVDGILFSKDMTTLYAYPVNRTNTSYTVPATVTKIDTRAFCEQPYLRSLNLSNVEFISGWAFMGMTSLQSITIPATVTQINANILNNCTSLTSLTFNATPGNKEIGHDICRGCTALRTVDLRGSSITQINNSAFRDCTALTNVYIGNSVRYIDDYCFNGCSSLTSLTFPGSVIYIYGQAFEGSGITPDKFPSWIHRIDGTNSSYSRSALIDVTGTDCYSMVPEVLEIVNQRRAEEGLDPLVLDDRLTEFAMLRAEEQVASFGHTRPFGYTVFSDVTGIGAENCARGSSTASAVMAGWMSSSGHRANIMNSSFHSIGIGCFIYNGTCYWVQVFSKNVAEGSSVHQDATGTRTLQVDLSTAAALTILNAPTSALRVGNGYQLNARFSYEAGATASVCYADPSNFVWTSSDPDVVSVTTDGYITAHGAGTAVITASFSRDNVIDISSTVTLTVRQDSIESDSVTIGTITNQFYGYGDPVTPSPVIKDNNTRLTRDVDYRLEYSDNTEIGTATVTITGIGYYTGTREVTFNIVPITFSSSYVTVSGITTNTSFDYTGQPRTFDITVTDRRNGSTLTEGTDYTVTYTGDNVNPGTFTVKVQGQGHYSSSSLTYRITINRLTFAREDVTIGPGVIVRDGNRYTLYPDAVSITVNGTALQRGVDFQVDSLRVYSSTRATIDVYGLGGYSGGGFTFEVGDLIPTNTPSPSPTVRPTVSPTVSPSPSPSPTVRPTVSPTSSPSPSPSPTDTPRQFEDVQDPGAYYYDAVYWASGNGITTGTTPTTFSPNKKCTREQIITFIWRTMGEPQPQDTAYNAYFDDTKEGAYYISAVNWAYETGITRGVSDRQYGIGQTCTRAMCVSFIYRAAGEPAVTGSNPFTDVPSGAYYYNAVMWCVRNGITTGTTPETFSPNNDVTRGQTVTFLYRARSLL